MVVKKITVINLVRKDSYTLLEAYRWFMRTNFKSTLNKIWLW